MNNVELLQFLDSHGLTDEEFAEMLDVTPGAVRHWVRGVRKVPSTVSKLIRVFRLKPHLMREFL